MVTWLTTSFLQKPDSLKQSKYSVNIAMYLFNLHEGENRG